MDGLNEIKLIGNVGKDVELKHLENDRKVARIVLATNKTFKKQNGEKESKTEWHNIEFWGDTAQFCGNYIKKGMLLYVCGELRTDSYENKDGIKQYRVKIAGADVKILSNGSSTPSGNGFEEGNNTAETARQQSEQYVSETISTDSQSNNEDSDMPF
jgi:single-strand DNA-binding protein